MVHVFVQKSDGICYWFSYDTDRGREEEWTKMGSYMICTGHQMSGYFLSWILYKQFTKFCLCKLR